MSSSNNSGPSKHTLSERERNYLQSGDTGSYSASALDERIDGKVSHLQERVQRLIDEVARLSKNGFLEDQWGNGENSLAAIEPRLKLREPQTWLERVSKIPDDKKEHLDLPSEPTDEIEAGFAFGQLLRALYLNDGPEQRHEELVWGFALGLVGQPAEYNSEERDLFDYLAEYIEREANRRYEHAEVFAPWLPTTEKEPTDWRFNNMQLLRALPRDIINDAGYHVTEPLCNAVEEKLDEKGDRQTGKNTLKALSELELETGLLTGRRFIDRLESDLNQLDDKSWHGDEAMDVLKALWDATGAQTSAEICRKINGTKQLTSKLLNDIAGVGTKSEEWEEMPLARQERDHYSLTPYGSLLGWFQFGSKEPSARIHEFALGQELNNEEVETWLSELFDEYFEL